MLFALDSTGNRIYIDATAKGEEYFCPCCGSRLVLKKGTERVHHFAHSADSICHDTWHYDMTEWHYNWQDKFPKECQEIVKEKNGQKHRADVLIEKEKVVFEFQHSQLSPYEFGERNAFYNALGYKVIWVFDVEDQYRNAQIENYNTNKWSWKWSKDTFNNFEAKDNRNTIYLQLDNDEPFLIKVIWNAPNKGMSRFSTDGEDYNDTDLAHLFDPRTDLNNVFALWKEYGCTTAIFKNHKTGNFIKITSNPSSQLTKYGKVYGYLSNNSKAFPLNSSVLFYLNKQQWTISWFSTNQED